jgi:transposase
MPKKQHQVMLNADERQYLQEVIQKGMANAREIRRAHTLLLADEQQQDQHIAAFLHVNPNTVSATRKRYCEVGLPAGLKEKARPGNPRKLDGKQEAFVAALACSEAPEGRDHWTLQLLADKLVELGVVEEPISDETVRRTLKKTTSNPG